MDFKDFVYKKTLLYYDGPLLWVSEYNNEYYLFSWADQTDDHHIYLITKIDINELYTKEIRELQHKPIDGRFYLLFHNEHTQEIYETLGCQITNYIVSEGLVINKDDVEYI